MRQFDCPQCGAPVPFETPGAVFAVCGHCQSMVVRRDTGLESIGTMADLPPDNTPLQIGAKGRHRDRSFRLLGRLRVGWDDGFWNEWYADFGDGRHGWVAESQGFFLISEAAPTPANIAHRTENLTTDKKVPIGREEFVISDVKKARVVAGEGELPFVARPNDEWTSIDLTGPGRKFAGIERQGDKARFYLGEFAQPEEIVWEGLKAVPGWKGEPVPIEKNRTDSLACPACGGTVTLRAAGLTMTLVCGHCGTLVDTTQGGQRAAIGQKIKASEKIARPILPLGTRGILRGVEWEIIGCLKREDKYSNWTEFLLYNPWSGFTWLTEWQSHWNFIRRVLESPDGASSTPVFNGAAYRIFAREDAKVTQVVGEFYWRVRVGEKAKITDYIAPPRILSSETYKELNETTWSEGEYLDPSEIAAAFRVTNLTRPSGPYANAPNPWEPKCQRVKRYAIFALVALCLIQILSMGRANRRKVLDEDLIYKRPEAGATAAAVVSPSFELKGQSPARLEIKAPVDNAWLGVDADLVNETTGQTFSAPVSVEYYHGYDDGNWTEGKQAAATDLPGVPPGRYHLAFTPEADPSISTLPFHVTVQHGGLFWSNFLLCALVILIWPVWAWFRTRNFEALRWSQSDFSTDGTTSDDDE